MFSTERLFICQCEQVRVFDWLFNKLLADRRSGADVARVERSEYERNGTGAGDDFRGDEKGIGGGLNAPEFRVTICAEGAEVMMQLGLLDDPAAGEGAQGAQAASVNDSRVI